MNNPIELFSVSLTGGILATYIPLFLAAISLIKFNRKVPLLLCAASVIMALQSGLISFVALPTIALIFFTTSGLCYFPKYKIPCSITLFLLGVAVFLHQAPGFNNPLLIDNIQLSSDAIVYSMYLNFDKAIFGIIVLIMLRNITEKKPSVEYRTILAIVAIPSILAFTIGLIGGLIAWSPKIPQVLFIWALSNLFITCVVEEAFFRGFIQRQLQLSLRKRNKPEIHAVIATSLLFGAVHAVGGPLFMVLATLMGFGYGYLYYRTGSLRWAIAFHFGFNATHLLLFSYPLLASN